MKNNKTVHSNTEILVSLYKQDNIPCILYAKDKQCRYIYISQNADKIDWIDGGKENTVLGKTAKDIIKDKKLGQIFFEQDQKILETEEAIHTYSEIIENGKRRVFEVKKNPIYVENKLFGISGVINDVTEEMELKRRFEELTYTDEFTKCYNRNYFLKQDFDKTKYLPCTYIMCDCNNLKTVNDQLGHQEGDKYIKSTVEILKETMPAEGICVRWGGDEFLMIIPNCGIDQCNKLLHKIEKKEKEKRKDLSYIDIAIGFFVRKEISQSEEEVIKLADQEMYKNKKRKKDLDGNKKGI